MAKYLIINADDFGMCKAANIATMELLEMGGISSATIMMPCSWAVDACKWTAQHPEYAIGLHLTLTSEWGKYRWRPVAPEGVASLVDEFGYMYPENDEFEENCDIDEVETEIKAQIALAKKFGVEPSHLDNHMGCLYGLNGNTEVLPLTFKICGELGYAFRMFRKIKKENIPKSLPVDNSEEMANMLVGGICRLADSYNVPLGDHLLFTHWDEKLRSSYEYFREWELNRLANIEDGEITEIFIHPSIECDELKGITSNWQARVWEHRLFSDPETRKYLESQGVVYINYRDLVRMRAEGK